MKIYLGSPVYKDVVVEHHESMQYLSALLRQTPGVELIRATVRGDADVGRARNVAASMFLQSNADVLLTIDGDIWFGAHDALNLCGQCLNQYPIIGGLYMTRGGLNAQPAQLLGIGNQVTMQPGERPVPVEFLATGFMAVRREVFEKLTEHPEVKLCMQSTDTPFWTFYLQKTIPWPNDVNLYLSEDYAFCHRAREMGYDIHLDPSIRLGHVGQYTYTLEDMIAKRYKPCPIRLTPTESGTNIEAMVPDGDAALLGKN